MSLPNATETALGKRASPSNAPFNGGPRERCVAIWRSRDSLLPRMTMADSLQACSGELTAAAALDDSTQASSTATLHPLTLPRLFNCTRSNVDRTASCTLPSDAFVGFVVRRRSARSACGHLYMIL
jgi:hypothetical protein